MLNVSDTQWNKSQLRNSEVCMGGCREMTVYELRIVIMGVPGWHSH